MSFEGSSGPRHSHHHHYSSNLHRSSKAYHLTPSVFNHLESHRQDQQPPSSLAYCSGPASSSSSPLSLFSKCQHCPPTLLLHSLRFASPRLTKRSNYATVFGWVWSLPFEKVAVVCAVPPWIYLFEIWVARCLSIRPGSLLEVDSLDCSGQESEEAPSNCASYTWVRLLKL